MIFNIKDPATGRTLRIDGPGMPSEADIDEMFAKAYPQPSSQPQDLQAIGGLENDLTSAELSPVGNAPVEATRSLPEDLNTLYSQTIGTPLRAGASAFNAGMGGLSEVFANTADEISSVTGMESGGLFRNAQKEFEENKDYWDNKFKTEPHNAIGEFVGKFIGGMVPGVITWEMGVPIAAKQGWDNAIKTGENPYVGATKEAINRLTMGGVFKGLSHLNPNLRVPAGGAIFGLDAAAHGESVPEGIATGMALTIPGRKMGEGVNLRQVVNNARESVGMKPMDLISKGDRIRMHRANEELRLAADIPAKDFYKDITPDKEAEVNLTLKRMGRKTTLQELIKNDEIMRRFDAERKQSAEIDKNKPTLPAFVGEGAKSENYKRQTEPRPGEQTFFEKKEDKGAITKHPEEIEWEKMTEKQRQDEVARIEKFKQENQGSGGKEKKKKAGVEFGFFGSIRSNPFISGVVNHVSEFIRPGSTMLGSNDWLSRRGKVKGDIDKGERFAGRLLEKYGWLNDGQREIVWDFLNKTEAPVVGQGPASQLQPKVTLANMPPELRPVAINLLKIDKALGRMMVDAGIISKETFLDNQAKGHIKYIYNMYLNENKSHIGVNKASVKQRLEMEDSVKEAKGLIKDPLVAITKSIVEATRNVAFGNYTKSVLHNPAWVYEPSIITINTPNGTQRMGIGKAKQYVDMYRDAEVHRGLSPEEARTKQAYETAIANSQILLGKDIKDYVQLSGAKYGALDGVYVNRTIANDMRPVFAITEKDVSKFVDISRQIAAKTYAYWKMKNVALNIPTLARNALFSNIIQLNMSGMGLHKIPRHMWEAVESMRKNDWKYQAAVRQGLFKTNFSESEMNELVQMSRDWGKDSFRSMGDIYGAVMKLGKFYGKIDDFYKMVKFNEQLELGMKATANKSQSMQFQTEEAKNAWMRSENKKSIDSAAREANFWVMDYSLAAPSIKSLRNMPLGAPYMTYSYKSIGLIAKALSNPKTAAMTLKWMALPSLINYVNTRGMTDEDVDNYKKSVAKHVLNGQVALFPDAKGGYFATDASYLVPWGNLVQTAYAMKDWKGLKQLGLGQGLAPAIAWAVYFNEDIFTGKPIVSEMGRYDAQTKAMDISNYVWRMFMPSMFTKYGAIAKIYEHEKYGKTESGMNTPTMNVGGPNFMGTGIDLPGAEMQMPYLRLAGVNTYPVNPRGAVIEHKMDAKALISEINKKIRQARMQGRSNEEIQMMNNIRKKAIEEIWGRNKPSPDEEYKRIDDIIKEDEEGT